MLRAFVSFAIVFTISAAVKSPGSTVNATGNTQMVRAAETVVKLWPGFQNDAKLVLGEVTWSKPVGGHTSVVFNGPGECQAFGVDVESGQADYWRDNSYEPLDEGQVAGKNPQKALHASVIATKTLDFVETHYPGFEQRELKQDCAVSFQHRLASDAFGSGLIVSARSDIHTGDAHPYRNQGPVRIPTDARINKETAEAAAMGVFSSLPGSGPISPVRSVFIKANYGTYVGHDDIGLQRLFWSIAVVTSPDATLTLKRYLREKDQDTMRFVTTEHGVLVDALTGEVAFADGYGMGYDLAAMRVGKNRRANTPLPRACHWMVCFRSLHIALAGSEDSPLEVSVPPLLIDGVPYLYVRCVAALLGRNVAYDRSGRVTIGGSRPVVLELNKKSAPMSKHPVRVLFDRLYLPLDTANDLFDCSIKWDAQSGTLVFPNPK